MRCLYCEVEVTTYPENGICPQCGGRLPPKPASAQPTVQPVVQTVYVQPSHQGPLTAGADCCPRCYSRQIIREKRGFSWGLAILGFFLFPVFGLLLGLCGRNKLRGHCMKCGHLWKL